MGLQLCAETSKSCFKFIQLVFICKSKFSNETHYFRIFKMVFQDFIVFLVMGQEAVAEIIFFFRLSVLLGFLHLPLNKT